MQRLFPVLAMLVLVTACSEPAGVDTSTAGAATTVALSHVVNLAATARVTSSGALPGQPVSLVNDGVKDVPAANFWGSGDFPPQWIEFDLGVEATVQRLVLLVSQSPDGPTVHRILGRGSTDSEWVLLKTIASNTSDGQVLIVESAPPWTGIRHLRVETVESPSWVSWGEIEVWGERTSGAPEFPTTTTRPGAFTGPGPDVILHGGTVITVDEEFTVAEALALTDGAIDAVGSEDSIVGLQGWDTRMVDLNGATVMPGIVDPHIHMIQRDSPDQMAMAGAQSTIIESGRTSVGIPGVDPAILEGFEQFDDLAVLRMRLYVRYNTNCGELPPDPGFWQSIEFGDDPARRIVVVGVKVFADGGSCHGPAVSWEYPDTFPEGIPFGDWEGNGSLFVTAEELAGVVVDVEARGGQVVVHAAGERAVVTVLDGMEQALDHGGNPARHRMDHNDFVPPEQRSRYGRLGVIPVVFGDYDSCFPGGGMWASLAPEEQLGWHRANRSMVEANPGLPVAWHSDLPFTQLDIFAQLQMLVNVAEVTSDGVYCDPPPFLADEGVDIEQAIRMMTWNSSYAMNLDALTGSLEPGKWADLIVVEKNPLGQPVGEVYQNTVWATVIDGVAEYCGGPVGLCDSLGFPAR